MHPCWFFFFKQKSDPRLMYILYTYYRNVNDFHEAQRSNHFQSLFINGFCDFFDAIIFWLLLVKFDQICYNSHHNLGSIHRETSLYMGWSIHWYTHHTKNDRKSMICVCLCVLTHTTVLHVRDRLIINEVVLCWRISKPA